MRLRDLGITVGILPTGPLNAITDVQGVQVGHTTLIEGENILIGVFGRQLPETRGDFARISR